VDRAPTKSAGLVDHDLRKPGAKAAPTRVETLAVPPSTNQRFLDNIIGGIRRTDPSGEAEQRLNMRLHSLGKVNVVRRFDALFYLRTISDSQYHNLYTHRRWETV